METDSFFCQLLKQLPQTLFELLGLPAKQARGYRFDSVEVKKSFRIDGLFLPRRASMPLYFVEVQFRSLATFYAWTQALETSRRSKSTRARIA